MSSRQLAAALFMWIALGPAAFAEPPKAYENGLVPLKNPPPIFADYPHWVEPIGEAPRFEASPLVNDAKADLAVRAWRFSYNARGIIEIPNHLEAASTAIVVVHPW